MAICYTHQQGIIIQGNIIILKSTRFQLKINHCIENSLNVFVFFVSKSFSNNIITFFSWTLFKGSSSPIQTEIAPVTMSTVLQLHFAMENYFWLLNFIDREYSCTIRNELSITIDRRDKKDYQQNEMESYLLRWNRKKRQKDWMVRHKFFMQSQSSERTTVVWQRTYCASEKNRIKKKKNKTEAIFGRRYKIILK